MVSLPVSLLKEVDRLAGPGRGSRSQVFTEAMSIYLAQARRRQMEENLSRGYQEMAPINLALAEEGLAAENEGYVAFRPLGAE